MSELANIIDQTLLNPAATSADIERLCEEALEYKFFAVCVHPVHVRQAVRKLSSSEIVVATTIGFPLGANLTDIKIAEAQRAVFEGAEELDLSMNIGALKEGDIQYVTSEIESVVRAAREHRVKVIIECDLLLQEEKVAAVQACIKAGAFMVKTSSGFVKDGKGATLEDVHLLKETIGDAPLKIKASGGIKDYKKAKELIDAGASRLGTSSGVQIIQESLALTNVH
ncbi:MAG: deoxyribose-phosphate aldolase [Candidatus Melainabacteria bacterium]|nr:MAG: deoxyribose-phosphate aldolase [Candidatus Melainabacteria bacterium]